MGRVAKVFGAPAGAALNMAAAIAASSSAASPPAAKLTHKEQA